MVFLHIYYFRFFDKNVLYGDFVLLLLPNIITKMHQEEVTLQSLTDNDCIKVSYSDNDIVVVDDVQQFAEFGSAHISLNGIAVCTSGRVTAMMNSNKVELNKNQVAVVPKNAIITDLMLSPDFKLKAMFFSDRMLQSFLHEKISIWNETMYIHRNNILTLDDDAILFYDHFYSMLKLVMECGPNHIYYSNEVIQSLLRAAMLALCGAMKASINKNVSDPSVKMRSSPSVYFQRFLDLLHSGDVRNRSVQYYAKQLCITPKYLTIICKKHSGKTPLEWITGQAIENIRYYLRYTDLSIKQICDVLNFASPSFFGKYVRQHLGVTPGNLRSGEDSTNP